MSNAAMIERGFKKLETYLSPAAIEEIKKLDYMKMRGLGNVLTFLASDIENAPADPHMDRIAQEACDWMNSQL